jgi:hypothetical protein
MKCSRCEREATSRGGFCKRHYNRARLDGEIECWKPQGRSLRERIDHFTTPEPTSGCWLWTGWIESNGYGSTHHGGTKLTAHRASWLAFRGPIPSRMFVLHRCDNRACVNPDHLFIGTHAENMQDMKSKGRSPHGALHGESHPKAKLTYEAAVEVAALVRSGADEREVAARFGIVPRYARSFRWMKEWGGRPL